MRYRVTLEREKGLVNVYFPDVPGAQTFGDDEQEALARAVDALETMFMGLIEYRKDIPRPRAPKRGEKTVTLPALTVAKLELYQAMRAAGVGKAELARRLNCHLPQIDRLLDLSHGSRLDQLEQAFAALGKRLEVAIQNAA
jgi:antitoxin HicB